MENNFIEMEWSRLWWLLSVVVTEYVLVLAAVGADMASGISKARKRVSRNLVGINFRHPNVMPNFAVWKTITYRLWHRWCCQPRF